MKKNQSKGAIKALILAGGLGTRLRPVTYEIPKPLITVNKKPIINYLIELFLRFGIDQIGILISGSHRLDFEKWKYLYKSELPFKKISFFEEEKPMGTFGGVFHISREWLQESEYFFVSNGDEIKNFSLEKMLNFHIKHQPLATVALVKVANPQQYGVALMERHLIKTFLEKPANPPSKYISSGLYLVSRELFNWLEENHRIVKRKKYSMWEKDVFPRLAQESKLAGFKTTGLWADCGTFQRWEEAIRKIRRTKNIF